MNLIATARLCLLLAAAAIPAACSPVTVSFTLFADNSRLEEATVKADRNAGEDKILMIDVRGLISDREGGDFFSSGPNPVDDLAAKLAKAESEASIKGVVLRINSPGGTVSASDMMYREIRGFSDAPANRLSHRWAKSPPAAATTSPSLPTASSPSPPGSPVPSVSSSRPSMSAKA